MEVNMDKQYEKDLENFCDHGDVGDDWCGDDVVQAILTWIKSNIEYDDPVLDIGCGNGAFIFQMCHLGYTDVTGIDKSPNAIKLATEISHQECVKATLKVCDVLGSCPSKTEDSPMNKKYKLLLDKGLFDTVSTATDNVEEFRRTYLKNTHELLRPDGILLVATCCHTKEEIIKQIGKGFQVRNILRTPVFRYGGKEGHNVTVVAFHQKN